MMPKALARIAVKGGQGGL
jgi:hypothetical protein